MANEIKGKYDKAFEMLEQLINQEVYCIYTESRIGQYKGYRGTLNSVTPYDSIVLEGRVHRFVGDFDAIAQIGIEIDGKPHAIFHNSGIKKDYPIYSTDPLGLISAQKEMLGYSVKEQDYFKKTDVKAPVQKAK
ncbi:MAG: hypothetical protein HFE81_06545 [Bacilli bacterium]|nr:hypothetical protein [Bacilli bacterium]